jgi:hypothetical protein
VLDERLGVLLGGPDGTIDSPPRSSIPTARSASCAIAGNGPSASADTAATYGLSPPATSTQIADVSGLNERYVREWLGGMTTAKIVVFDPATATYWLPREHAASLTRAAGPDNLARLAQYIAVLGDVEQQIVESFRTGGGVPYSAYPRFHQIMAEESARCSTLPWSTGSCHSFLAFRIGCAPGSTWPTLVAAATGDRRVGPVRRRYRAGSGRTAGRGAGARWAVLVPGRGARSARSRRSAGRRPM